MVANFERNVTCILHVPQFEQLTCYSAQKIAVKDVDRVMSVAAGYQAGAPTC